MNAIVALCHFCEAHGPQPLFCTFKTDDDKLLKTSQHTVECNGCRSIGPETILISKDIGAVFCSRESIPCQEVTTFVKQAAIRSITCETNSNKGDLVYFSETKGFVLSHTFQLKDTHARGLKRWFSIVILAKDKYLLLNLLPLLTDNIKKISKDLQDLCEHVYDEEQKVCSQRALRLSLGQYNFSQSRSLPQLTGDDNIYSKLHERFTFILKSGALQYREHLYYSKDLLKKLSININECKVNYNIEQVSENCMPLKELQRKLGTELFKILMYCTLIGIQIIINSTHTESQIISKALSCLLPTNNEEHKIPFNSKYSPCSLQESDNQKWSYQWNGSLKTGPTMMRRIERAMESSLNDRTLHLRVKHLQLEWLTIAKAVQAAVKASSANSQAVKELKRTFGMSQEDDLLVDFWCNNFC